MPPIAIQSTQRLAVLGLAAALLAGCASERPLYECNVGASDALAQVDMRQLIDGLVAGLCPPEPPEADAPREAVVVPDLVDVQTLQPGRIGVALGDLFRASVASQCRVPVRQVELSRHFRLNSAGLIALSRNQSEVRQAEFPASTAMVATYHLEGSRITLVGRRIDIASSTYLAASSREASWSCSGQAFGAKRLVHSLR